MIQIEPTFDKEIPVSTKPDEAETLADHARVMGNTALLLNELGDDEVIEMTEEDVKQSAEMIKKLKIDGGDQTKESKNKDKATRKEMTKSGVALALGHFVGYYGQQVIEDKIQLRNIAVNTLLEVLETSQDEKNRLKAAELLGKAGDLFTDKAEITITHKTSDELKSALRQRIEMLMQMQAQKLATPVEKAMSHLDKGDAVDVEAKEVKEDDDSAKA
jgi:RPA family protein